MAENYYIKISKKYELPTLLSEFAQWLKGRPYGEIGWFEFIVDRVPSGLIDKKKDKPEELFTIFHLPDGSVIALDKIGSVLHFDSEKKGAHKIAKSLKEFLHNLSEAETGIDDLDEESDGRKNLQEFLGDKNEKNKEKKESKKSSQASTISYKDFLTAVGKDIEAVEVKNLLSKLQYTKMPAVSKGESDVYLTLSKQGITLIFDKNKKSLVLAAVQLYPKSPQNGISEPYNGELPTGLQFSDMEKEVHIKLGKPSNSIKARRRDNWKQGQLILSVEYRKDTKRLAVFHMNLNK